MLLNILDALGISQKVIVRAQEVTTDYSGAITATGVSQEAAPANTLRSGLFVQNLSTTSPLYFEERGVSATTTASIMLAPGASLPPDFPVTANALNVLGTSGQPFVIREW